MKVRAMIPFADMFNHTQCKEDAHLHHYYDSTRRSMVYQTVRSILKDEQVFLYYGDYSNSQLFRIYGFCFPPLEPCLTPSSPPSSSMSVLIYLQADIVSTMTGKDENNMEDDSHVSVRELRRWKQETIDNIFESSSGRFTLELVSSAATTTSSTNLRECIDPLLLFLFRVLHTRSSDFDSSVEERLGKNVNSENYIIRNRSDAEAMRSLLSLLRERLARYKAGYYLYCLIGITNTTPRTSNLEREEHL